MPTLAARLALQRPAAIAIVLRRIERDVRCAIELAALSCPVHVLPFPGNGHQNSYIAEMIPLIGKYVRR